MWDQDVPGSTRRTRSGREPAGFIEARARARAGTAEHEGRIDLPCTTAHLDVAPSLLEMAGADDRASPGTGTSAGPGLGTSACTGSIVGPGTGPRLSPGNSGTKPGPVEGGRASR